MKLDSEFLVNKKILTYDVESFDYSGIDVDTMYSTLTSQVENGSIIGFHDGSDNEMEWQSRPLQIRFENLTGTQPLSIRRRRRYRRPDGKILARTTRAHGLFLRSRQC